MGRITVELVRKKAEHNEGEIGSLEELSLHQEKLEKIELLDHICRKLKILLLQNNAISIIENVGRLKDLEYLNLALNMIEKIENLDGCESLKKLDLTLNFIGEISSIKSLRPNYFLEQLYLVGNPCHEFPGYRDYVIATLPQLKQLDGVDITRSERLTAKQNLEDIEELITVHEDNYLRERERAKAKASMPVAESDDDNRNADNVDQDDNKAFWSQMTENTPEVRKEMILQLEKQDEKKKSSTTKLPIKPPRKLETVDGQPLNVNEPKISFSLHDEMERNQIILDLAVPKFMCTTLINADVQPTFVRVSVKGKIFQLLLPEEVRPDSSYAQRSQVTGHLIVTMPKVHESSSLVWRSGESQVINLSNVKSIDDTSQVPSTFSVKEKGSDKKLKIGRKGPTNPRKDAENNRRPSFNKSTNVKRKSPVPSGSKDGRSVYHNNSGNRDSSYHKKCIPPPLI